MEMGPLHNMSGQWRSVSKFYQWMSEQKGLSPRGCRMWAHTAKCLTSCQGFPDHMQLNCTTCQITRDSTRCSAYAKFRDFRPTRKTWQTDLKNLPLQTANTRVSRKPFFWARTPRPTSWESHTGKNNVELSDKNPINLGPLSSIPHSADRVGTVHK